MHQEFKTSSDFTDYAIGDVHGCFDQLKIALDWCAADALRQGTFGRVHLLGDYVDRGPNSRDVVDLLIRGSQDAHMSWHPIKGNHDDMFSKVWFDPEHSFATAWWEHGGQQTLQSYGWNPLYNDIPDHLNEWVPEEHALFLHSLPMTAITETHIYVHAGLRPNIALEDQTLHDMMWIRGDFSRTSYDFGKVVVYGHTPDKLNPRDHGTRIAMDSGCFGSGILSVAAFDNSGLSLRFQTISKETEPEPSITPSI